MLDNIEELEKEEDDEVEEIENSAHVANLDFDVSVMVENRIVVSAEPEAPKIDYTKLRHMLR